MQQNNHGSDKKEAILTPVMSALGALLTLPLFSTVAMAQRPLNPNAAPCAGCAACGGCWVTIILLALVILALHIALLVWVARDAKSRGMDSAVLWMVLVMITGLVGFIIYIFSRPQGNLIQCASCQNKRLQASAKCPHCGNP